MTTDLKSLSEVTLISDVKKLVGEERRIAAELLHYLCEVQRRSLFALYGFPSLFSFCVKYLGYTESQTQRRLEAMRVMTEIPEIEAKIKDGSLSLTAVAQAQSYFKSQERGKAPVSLESKKDVLSSLESKSTRECERELIKFTGERPLPKEKIKVISSDHSQVTLNFSNDLMEKLERIKSLLSNKNPNMSQSELVDEMAEIVLDKIDPTRREKRETQRAVSPARIVDPRKFTMKRDFGKCTYVSPITNQKCESAFQLEVDHIIPRALGGTATPDNLRLLCKTHNQRAAIEAFGLEKMNRYINKGRRN